MHNLVCADLAVLAERADAAFDVEDVADVDGGVDGGVAGGVGCCCCCCSRGGLGLCRCCCNRSPRLGGEADDTFKRRAAAVVDGVEVARFALVNGDYHAGDADPFDGVVEVEVDILACCDLAGGAVR